MTEMKIVVCVPTYNERGNLELLLRALGRIFDEHRLAGRVLVIDDASPDGTGDLAEQLAGELSFVSVLHRPRKEGLGPAYLDGFRVALEKGADLVLEMDCDFSHNPADIPRLVAAATDADLILGSRYVVGGGTRDWGPVRRLISGAGSFYARMILGVPVRDLTGGFKCYRRRVLETIDLKGIDSRGYAFQIEMTYQALLAGFRVKEIPIIFSERRLDRSKMNWSIALEAMWRIPLLRLSAVTKIRKPARKTTAKDSNVSEGPQLVPYEVDRSDEDDSDSLSSQVTRTHANQEREHR